MPPRKPFSAEGLWVTVAILLVLGLIVAIMLLKAWDIERDPKTGCSINDDAHRIANTYAILIDASDPVQDQQKNKVKLQVESLLESTECGEREDRYQIYFVESDEAAVLEPAFDQCSYTASIAEAPVITRYREEEFDKRLDKVLESGRPGNSSPIIHAIHSVATRMPRDRSEKHAIVISDFYENSSIANLYRNRPEEELNPRLPELQKRMPDLRDIRLYLRVIYRERLPQDNSFKEAWRRFFLATGAKLRPHTIRGENGCSNVYLPDIEGFTW